MVYGLGCCNSVSSLFKGKVKKTLFYIYTDLPVRNYKAFQLKSLLIRANENYDHSL
jgi:hypothetical protein